MSKRNRQKSRARTPSDGSGSVAVMAPPDSGISGGGEAVSYSGNFVGAGTSPARGVPAWSTLDTRFEIGAGEHREMMRRARALVGNSGIARVLLTIAMMVGSQTPQMASEDAEWNEICEKLLRFENASALISDRAGQHNLEDAQRLIEFLAMRDGDCFIELTKTETGRAAYRIHEAHEVWGQPAASWGGTEWNQGIKFNAEGRPVAYWFEPRDLMGTQKGREVPAASVIHYTYRDAIGVRGVSALAPAILHIIDIIERRGFTKAALKLRSMIGMAVQSDVEAKKTGDRPMIGGLKVAPGSSPSGRDGQVANSQDRGPKVEDITMAGNSAAILRLEPGEKAELLNDDSPSPNATDFENELLRDVAIGLQMPPQVIFWLEKQTGPMVRFTVRMAERRLEERRKHMRNVFLNRWIAYQLACAGKSGRLYPDSKPIPDDWHACAWQEPASMTIDVGRDGNLELKQLDAGVASMADVVGQAGGDWEDTIDQRGKEALYIATAAKTLMDNLAKGGVQLTYDQCLAMIKVQPKAATSSSATPDEKNPAP